MALGESIRLLRNARGWQQKDLEAASGVAIGTISAMEVRDSKMSQYASSLAAALGVSVETLADTDLVRSMLSTGEGTMEVQGSLARVADGPQTAAMVAAAPTLTQALEVLAAHMDNLSEADREAAAQSLQTLARAPDSAKAKAGALASLGAQHNTAIGAGETPHFLKK